MKSKIPSPPKPKYFVYFLVLNNTGHYYIGMTQNPTKRENQHYNIIRNLIVRKKDHDYWRSFFKRKPIPYVPTTGHKVHWFFAWKILPKVSHFVTPGKTITHYYNFYIKHICYTVEEAIRLESHYLESSKTNKFCLNTQMASCYKKGNYET